MNDARLVDRVFAEALGIAEDEREALVIDRCGGDRNLISRVLALLELSSQPEAEIEGRFGAMRNRLWQDMLSADSEHQEDLSGSVIGAWSIKQLLARGGLATVYMAQREDGVYQQTVALKVLRRGLDTDDLIRRFHAERKFLSALEHPGIAKILDGGALADGRPFLVLEYVDGLPITEHCIHNKLGIREKIRLVIDVARAIGHAHRRLIVHRDIKPSNILVTTGGKVSVLDFGIAKLLDPIALPGESPETRTGVSMLTPAYASPEQHAASTITTTSDIYQLGLLLYELLSGERPFAGKGNSGNTTLSAPSQSIPDSRQRRRVQGDLDAIVRKAAHVDAGHRYTSADELIADLNRYLEGLPILARPDSWRYRLGKLNGRKPWLMPLLALGLIAIGSYVITLSIYSARLAKQQQLTLASQEFLIDLFKSPDPFAPADIELGRNITVVEALEIGYKRVRNEFKDQPELRASLLSAISEVYASLDMSDIAIELREEVLQTELAIYGERSEPVVISMRALGGLYGAIGNREKAGELIDQQLVIATEIFNTDSPELGLSQIAAGLEALQTGDHEKSQSLLFSGINKLRPYPERYAANIISALIASTEQQGLESGETSLAAVAEAQAIAITTYGETGIQVASVRARAAATKTRLGDHEGSEKDFLAAIPVMESQLGTDHSVTLRTLNNLGYLYNVSGQHVRAEGMYRELLERQIAKNGLLHRSVGDTYQNLAGALKLQARFDESIPLHRKAYEIYKSTLSDNHYIIAFPLLSISYTELQLGDGPAAETAAREALSRFEATVPGSFLEGVAQCLVGLSLEIQGDIEEGSAMVTASHGLMKKGHVPDPYPALCRMSGI